MYIVAQFVELYCIGRNFFELVDVKFIIFPSVY